MPRLLLPFLFLLIAGAVRGQGACAARIGGCYFINCKSIVKYNGQDIVTFSDWARPVATVNLDVYGSNGFMQAQVRNGKLTHGSADRFTLKSSTAEFSMVDASTSRVICLLKNVESTTDEANCQVDVWLDVFMPGSGYFHCDPSTGTEPMLQMMGGALFKNSDSAIVLD